MQKLDERYKKDMKEFGHLGRELASMPPEVQKQITKVTASLVQQTQAMVREFKKKTNAGALDIMKLAVLVAERAVEQLRMEQQLACSKGCSYCCHLKVEAFDHELYGIVAHLMATRTLDEIRAFERRLVAIAEQSAGASPEEYLVKKLPCVFLENDACSIYPVRPITCVTYHSLDRDDCIRAHNNPDEPWVPQIAEIIIGVNGVSLGVLNVVDPKAMTRPKPTKVPDMHEALLPILRSRVKSRYGISLGEELNHGQV